MPSTAGTDAPTGPATARWDNQRVGINHYENFPVASVLSPPQLRPAVVALYHFARTADDIADEGNAPADERLADLAAYRRDLHAIYTGAPPSPRWARQFAALDRARREHQLPLALLEDLLDAFEQDVHNPRYDDRAQLVEYCRRSANPVGRLLLHLYGIDDARALARSDCICTALQLINFWQDLGRDLARGRVYLPRNELARLGISHEDPPSALADGRWQRLVGELCAWAGQLMCDGAPLVDTVPGRSGWELRLVVQGGLRILEKMRAMDHDTLRQRPVLRAFDGPLLVWRALGMRRAGSSRAPDQAQR